MNTRIGTFAPYLILALLLSAPACNETPPPDGDDDDAVDDDDDTGDDDTGDDDTGDDDTGDDDAGDDDTVPPPPCSGHGVEMVWTDTTVCACDPGFTPPGLPGDECLPTHAVCVGGIIDFDVDDDGINETWFDPTALECEMFERINYERATHDPEGSPECHHPLRYSIEWSAHGRNHAMHMEQNGGMFHADYPYAQNCAYGGTPEIQMHAYMTYSGEGHCPDTSHHCTVMRCEVNDVGAGYYPVNASTWGVQNYY